MPARPRACFNGREWIADPGFGPVQLRKPIPLEHGRIDTQVAVYRFGDYSLDPDRQELRARKKPVTLEPQVFAVLTYLVRNEDRSLASTARSKGPTSPDDRITC